PRRQNQAAALAHVRLDLLQDVRLKAKVRQPHLQTALVENTNTDLLAMRRRRRADAEVYRLVLHAHLETTVLRQPALGKVEVRQNLDAGDNRILELLRRRAHL